MRTVESNNLEKILEFNGMRSCSAEEIFSNVYDSNIDTLSIVSASDIEYDEEEVTESDTFNYAFNHQIENVLTYYGSNLSTLGRVYKDHNYFDNRNPVRRHQVLQNYKDSLKELKVADELLAETLISKSGDKKCIPRVRRFLGKVKKSSKRGATSAFTIILVSIV